MGVLDDVEKAIEEAKKLTTKDRKKLDKSVFCGPNSSFPTPDCKHVAVAKAYLDRSKFSESTKKKIAACINRRAKALKCQVSVKAAEGKEFSYSSLDKECKALYNSDVFAATKKMVDDSVKIPGNM